jgi:hypothetical protein
MVDSCYAGNQGQVEMVVMENGDAALVWGPIGTKFPRHSPQRTISRVHASEHAVARCRPAIVIVQCSNGCFHNFHPDLFLVKLPWLVGISEEWLEASSSGPHLAG